jgi:hypothetical protein
MNFLFKIIAILIGIFIWKTVVASFRKANKAIHEDSDDENAPVAKLDLESQWREAAKELGCEYTPGTSPDGKDAAITGRFSGHSVTIKRFGRNYVRYFVDFRNPPGFRVCVVRDLESIAERILDGHPIFPSKMFFSSQEPDFFCSAESEEAFDRFLDTPSNRSAVLNLVRLFPAGMFNNEGVSVRLRGNAPDISVISRMAAIANALESPSSEPMHDLLTAQKKDLLAVPQDFTPEVQQEEPDMPKRHQPLQVDVDAKTTRIPLPPNTPLSSQRTTVIRISSEAKRMNKSDTPKAGVVRSSSASASPAPASASPRIQPEPVVQKPTVAGDLTVESVCTALFGKAFPGAEERAAFDAMKGRRVRWSGELLMSMPFSMDFVFGSQKGVKATLLICKLAQGSVKVQIKAVAAFPPDKREILDAMKGKMVLFEGELLKFEPFAREIYLVDASLVS